MNCETNSLVSIRGGDAMKEPMSLSLPGLERLLGVCQRLNLGLETSPPARETGSL
jgi:hypothetical protein